MNKYSIELTDQIDRYIKGYNVASAIRKNPLATINTQKESALQDREVMIKALIKLVNRDSRLSIYIKDNIDNIKKTGGTKTILDNIKTKKLEVHASTMVDFVIFDLLRWLKETDKSIILLENKVISILIKKPNRATDWLISNLYHTFRQKQDTELWREVIYVLFVNGSEFSSKIKYPLTIKSLDDHKEELSSIEVFQSSSISGMTHGNKKTSLQKLVDKLYKRSIAWKVEVDKYGFDTPF